MARKNDLLSQMYLADALKEEVNAWANEGWPGVTQTTYELLHYWLDRDEDAPEKFYDCQRRAIETIIYCHEILQAKSLGELFDRVAPEFIRSSKPVYDEVMDIPFPKYCIKMATGTGKTWVLAALLVWQYFNAVNNEVPQRVQGETKDWYSCRFMVVAPGLEVLNRLLDSFKGKRDPKTGLRDLSTSDYARPLFMPESWRPNFHLDILEPSDLRPNTTPPDGPFVFITNWQQFRLKRDSLSLWEEYTGEDIEEEPRGEMIADFLSECPNIVIMNDEAHHVHARKNQGEELVWRRFIKELHNRFIEKHKKEMGLYAQIDFSATPFYGTGTQKEYFPHIVYDYDIVQAMRSMLVKQLFLEERQSVAGEKLEGLDFRALRKEPEEGKKRGEIIGLSSGQKILLEIGRKKLEQLAEEFKAKGIDKKPVMMVLCEQTEVANLVRNHFYTLMDNNGTQYDDEKVMIIHTDLKKDELESARKRLDKIDDNNDQLKVVISVLMLREGFDRKNICVTVVLRATEADLLLEQIVGRGLRLMYPKEQYPQIWQAKVEAMEDIRRNRPPSSSFDFLFIVEHPRFRQFYERLRREGYLIGMGDTSDKSSTGDIIPVDAIPDRVSEYDIGWPTQIYDQYAFPDISKIDVSKLPPYHTLGSFEDLRDSLGKLIIQETHVESGKKTKTWKLENKYFDYNFFLRAAAKAVAYEGKSQILSGHLSEIAGIIDEHVTHYLFGKTIDFLEPQNYQVLNYSLIFDHVVKSVRKAVLKQIGDIKYERKGEWRYLSKVGRLMLKEKNSVETWKCIYPRQGFSAVGGGFEKDYILEVLEKSVEVKAYAKLDKKHGLKIPYRDEYGILREYEVDFIVKTEDSIYLVETKADRDLDKETVAIKAKAAQSWCESACMAELPEGIEQPRKWEYLIISESLFKSNKGQSFSGLIPVCRELRDLLIMRTKK